MKILNRIYLMLFLAISILFISCQKEETDFIEDTTEETITADSSLAILLLRTSQNFGAEDDLIDRNSCTSLTYPVMVHANGQEVLLENVSDIQLVQNIFDQFPNDTDILVITYPIILIFEDFSQIEINSESELQALADSCDSSGGISSIGCVDFVYPITFFIYNSNQQQTGTATINNDLELFIFLQGLSGDDFISIDFPISVELEDGSVVQVNSNAELQQLILDCENGGTIDPIDPIEFEQNLTTGVWYITYFFDDYDATDEFGGYEFNFNQNNTAQAGNGTTTIDGTWQFEGGSTPELILFFGSTNPFDELDEDWDILEADEYIIRLKNISGDGSIDFLTYGRTPNPGGSNTTVNNFIQNLTTGNWYVNLLENDGINGTCELVEYIFTYNVNGTATAISPGNTVNGFWTVESSGGSDLDFILNFETSGSSDPFSDINDDWDVESFTNQLIKLTDSSGGSGNDILDFGRNIAPGCGGGGTNPDPQELRDIMQAGTWFVDLFLEDGNDETSDFNGYDFTFFANETVSASNGNQTVPGIWIVTLIGQELNFEFDMDSPLNRADDNDYKVLQYNETEVIFITLTSSGGIEDTLIIKKN